MTNDTDTSALGAHLWDAPPAKWEAEADDRLICCHVSDETHDVKTFQFRALKPALFRYRPGQFLTLDLSIDGETVNRCYTLSSAPTRPDTVSITVKRIPGGKVSNWLHDNLKPGSIVRTLGIAGDFSASLHPSEKYLFLSGGSGVTPLMSMLRTFCDLGENRDIVFLHSARTPSDIVFRRELAALSHRFPKLRTGFVCERADGERDWSAPTGYLTRPLLEAFAPDVLSRDVFCCGPAAYMAAVRDLLKGAGFDMARYHEESFTFGADAAPAQVIDTSPNPEPSSAGKFKIEFTRLGQTVECGADQSILEAARAAGMRLPFSCSQGVCGTCKTKKLSGEIVMKHGGGIRKREIDQGMILVCCSKPLSDVKLER